MEGLFLLEIDVPALFIGKKIKDLDVRNQFHVDIILIKKKSPGGELNTEIPRANYIFHHHDTLLLLGEQNKIKYMSKL